MRKILTILFLFVAVLSSGQDYREIDWETNVSNVQLLGQDTFSIDVFPTDFNDPGAITLSVGNYFIDYVNRGFKIIASSTGSITVVDLEGENTAPQINQTGRIYASVNGQDTLYHSIGGVDLSTTDPASRWRTVARWNEEFARAIATKQDTMPFTWIDLDPTPGEVPYQEARIAFNPTEHTLDVFTGIDSVVLQVNMEDVVLAWNGTADTIYNARGVTANGIITNGIPNMIYSSSYNHTRITNPVYITTMDIPPGEQGFVVSWGKIRAFNAGALLTGKLYLAPSNPADGTFSNSRAEFPFYESPMGGLLEAGVEATMFASPNTDPYNTILNIFNGTIREPVNFYVTSNGDSTIGVLSPQGSQDYLTLMFSDGLSLKVDIPDTITLVAGTDDVPQKNFIYIPKSTKQLAVSTTGWPAEEAKRLAYVILRTDATTLSDSGALVNQNANDNIMEESDGRGLLLLITERLRQEPAVWARVGVELTTSVDAGFTPNHIPIATTEGYVYQFRKQLFNATNTATGGDIHVSNYYLDSWKTVSDMSEVQIDALGASLKNGSFKIIYWGIQNKTGETSHIIANMPIGKYGKNSPQDAVSDLNAYAVYNIPPDYRSVGILIAAVTYTLDAAGNVYTIYDVEDLRGTFPNSVAGPGGGGGTGVTTFLGLLDTEPFYTALAFQRANSTATGLENVLAEDILLTEFDSVGFEIFISQVVGLTDSLFNLRSAITILEAESHSATTKTGTGTYLQFDIPTQVLNVDIIDTTSTNINQTQFREFVQNTNEVDYGVLAGEIPITNSTIDGFDYFTGLSFLGGFLSIPNGSGTAKSGIVETGLLDVKEWAGTGTPSSGRGYFYFKNTSLPYAINDAGIEFDLTAGQGYTGSHLDLTFIGINTHAEIDTHIDDGTIHYLQSAISITESQISDLGNYFDKTLDDTDDINEGTVNLWDKTVTFSGGTNVTIGGTYPSFVITDNSGTSNLALGETSTTAYRGDRGKIGYDYSQIGHLLLTGGTLTIGEGLGFVNGGAGTSLGGHIYNDSRIINLQDGNPPTDGALIFTYDVTTVGDHLGELLFIDPNYFEWKGNTIYHEGNLPAYPTVITNHSGLTLDDGTNPHGATQSDVGLGNVENAAASGLYEPLFSKNTGFNKNFGTIAGTVAQGNDSRFTDSRTPLAHKVSHQNGGSDEISVAGLSGVLVDNQPFDNTGDWIGTFDGQEGSYYLDYTNFTNTPTIPTSADYIENQTVSPQTAGFNITGAGTLGGNVTAGGTIKSASLQMISNRIENHITNATSNISINYRGYEGGTTQFRDLRIYDGKQGIIATITGSTKGAIFAGTIDLTNGTLGSEAMTRTGIEGLTDLKLDLDGGNANQDIDIGSNSFTAAGVTSTGNAAITGTITAGGLIVDRGASTAAMIIASNDVSGIYNFALHATGARDFEIRGGSSGDYSLNLTNTLAGGYNLNVGGNATFSGGLDVSGDATIDGALIDSNGSPGTSGQVISSTVTGIDWVDASSGLWTLSGSDIYRNSEVWIGTTTALAATPKLQVLGVSMFQDDNFQILIKETDTGEAYYLEVDNSDFSILRADGSFIFGYDYSSSYLKASVPDYNQIINGISGSSSYTEEWKDGDIITVTFTANTTIRIDNIPEGQDSQIRVQQSTGGHSLTLSLYSGAGTGLLTQIVFGANTGISTTAGEVTKIRYQRFGSDVDIVYEQEN